MSLNTDDKDKVKKSNIVPEEFKEQYIKDIADLEDKVKKDTATLKKTFIPLKNMVYNVADFNYI